MTAPAPFPKPEAPRRLSPRAPLDLLFLFCCILLTADVLVPEIFGRGILMLLSLPWFPIVIQAWGNNLAATAVLAGCLAWHIRHPPVAASSHAAVALKPGTS